MVFTPATLASSLTRYGRPGEAMAVQDMGSPSSLRGSCVAAVATGGTWFPYLPGDGLAIVDAQALRLRAEERVEALLFDLV